MTERIAAFLARHPLFAGKPLDVSTCPLTGGLEAAVLKATVSAAAVGPAAHVVVKQLRGLQKREAAFYREMWAAPAPPPAVQWLGTEQVAGIEYLYLECVDGAEEWPWADVSTAAAVCRALAQLHRAPLIRRELLQDWNYEAELLRSAEETLAVAHAVRGADGRRWWPRGGDLRRVIAELGVIRARLFAAGSTVIHGDVHPGNVLIRKDRDGEVAFVDWARARVGSPLEDVASWLHSLGCWEPAARRRHDTLLRSYLEFAGGATAALTAELRTLYWLASASNGLAGAIRYHLLVLANAAADARQLANSRQALWAWQRVIRQAAAICATTSARRRTGVARADRCASG